MGYNRNNFKLRFLNEPKFFINEKKGTVTCKINANLSTPMPDMLLSDLPSVSPVTLNGVGIAICRKEDKFDVNRGKRIAISRAENQCYLNAAKYLSDQRKKLNFLIDGIDEFTDKTYDCCAHNDDYIDSLAYPASPNYQEVVYAPKRGVDVYHKK